MQNQENNKIPNKKTRNTHQKNVYRMDYKWIIKRKNAQPIRNQNDMN